MTCREGSYVGLESFDWITIHALIRILIVVIVVLVYSVKCCVFIKCHLKSLPQTTIFHLTLCPCTLLPRSLSLPLYCTLFFLWWWNFIPLLFPLMLLYLFLVLSIGILSLDTFMMQFPPSLLDCFAIFICCGFSFYRFPFPPPSINDDLFTSSRRWGVAFYLFFRVR